MTNEKPLELISQYKDRVNSIPLPGKDFYSRDSFERQKLERMFYEVQDLHIGHSSNSAVSRECDRIYQAIVDRIGEFI